MIYDLGDKNSISFGEDFMCYDHFLDTFCVLSGKTINWNTFDFDRFETNYDIPTYIFTSEEGSYLHAVAIDNAINQKYNYCDDEYSAAEYFFYRIEVDNSKDGGFTYNINSSSTASGTVTWNAGDSVDSIRKQMSTKNYLFTYVTTNNPIIESNNIRSSTGEAIGIAIGGTSNTNVCTISNIVNDSCQLIDMSAYAVISDNLTAGDFYDSSLTTINSNYKNWRGTLCKECVGTDIMPYFNNSQMIGNSGYNYSMYSGANFSGFKTWASISGMTRHVTDGVNGTTNNSYQYIMNKAYFDDMMDSSNTNYNAAMYTYYNDLLNSNEDPYKTLRETYAEWYNYNPTTLYDVYIMTHMVRLEPTTGTGYTFMNKGKTITNIKGKIFTLTFNYTYTPAYAPEYNALHYGNIGREDAVFKPGFYYHPETLDLGISLRDDMMLKCNTTWDNLVGTRHSNRTNLINTQAYGTCIEYGNNSHWHYGGTYNVLGQTNRSSSRYLCRPMSMYKIN